MHREIAGAGVKLGRKIGKVERVGDAGGSLNRLGEGTRVVGQHVELGLVRIVARAGHEGDIVRGGPAG